VSGARVLAIGLDGYEASIGEALMASGRLPNLARLRARSARFELEHGAAKRTGLAWEHVSLGLSPEAASRFAAVHFDPWRYEVIQQGTGATPLLARCDVRAVVFDPPYFDLSRAPNCAGLVSWGAHDAGCAAHSRPATLAQEIDARFGAYPARPYIYGFVWPDPLLTRAMGDALVRAVDARAAIGAWLVGERFPEWDLALLVVSELHSALEGLWHGVDPCHPLHALPSAKPARDGVEGVYEAVDRLVGTLCDAAPDAQAVVFSMHGMGPNRSDVPSMLLLPELLYRAQTGRAGYAPRPEWKASPDGVALLGADESWSRAVLACCTPQRARSLRGIARNGWRRLDPRRPPELCGETLRWMPAARYRRCWSEMDAFALPSFYDGRVRINLRGRERLGRVAPRDYAARCDEVAELVGACRDPRTGEPVVETVERLRGDPLAAGATQADLVFTWRGAALAFEHPRLGVVGPAPWRRPGGHSGGHGVGWFAVPDAPPGDYGLRSAFDVVPTLLDLCGVAADGISGESLVPAWAAPARLPHAPTSANLEAR
jgi:predicted AlkP superfamily phosphohydrolase/phosphomutase